MNHSKPAVIQHALSAKDGAIVAAIRAQVAPMKGQMAGPAARPMFDQIMEQTPAANGVDYEEGLVGGVPGIWCRPRNARPDHVILYTHGGAYIMGSVKAYRNFVGQIATHTNATLFAADYGLAPEHPFPAALNDAVAVYKGLAERGAQRILIAGDSAGGGLALVLLAVVQAEADAGRGLAPSAAIVLSPWTDLALTGESLQKRSDEELFLVTDFLALARDLYAGAHDKTDARVSPLYGKLAGLPPIQLHAGTAEILLDDTLRYAERAQAGGVDVDAHVWDGMPHVFPASVGTLDAADEALRIMAEFAQDRFRT